MVETVIETVTEIIGNELYKPSFFVKRNLYMDFSIVPSQIWHNREDLEFPRNSLEAKLVPTMPTFWFKERPALFVLFL